MHTDPTLTPKPAAGGFAGGRAGGAREEGGGLEPVMEALRDGLRLIERRFAPLLAYLLSAPPSGYVSGGSLLRAGAKWV